MESKGRGRKLHSNCYIVVIPTNSAGDQSVADSMMQELEGLLGKAAGKTSLKDKDRNRDRDRDRDRNDGRSRSRRSRSKSRDRDRKR